MNESPIPYECIEIIKLANHANFPQNIRFVDGPTTVFHCTVACKCAEKANCKHVEVETTCDMTN